MKKLALFPLIAIILTAVTPAADARNIYVARHGQVGIGIKAISETRLTDLGIEQARQLADYLVNKRKFNGKIYVSPFYRTTETASYTAKLLNQKMILEPGIQEMAPHKTPSPRGMTLKEINSYFPGKTVPGKRYRDPWRLCQEDNRKRFIRVSKALEEILAEEKGDILLVCHGASVTDLVKNLNNRRPSRKVKPAKGMVWNCALFAFELNDKNEVIKAEYITGFIPKKNLTNNFKEPKIPRPDDPRYKSTKKKK